MTTRGLLDSPVVAEDVDRIVAADVNWDKLRGSSVLVTGATGMLPAFALFTLVRANEVHQLDLRLVALARRPEAVAATLADIVHLPNVDVVLADVVDDLGTLPIDSVDFIIHGASPARPSLHASDPVGSVRANVQGTLNVMELARSRHTRAVALMSSAEVYGQQPPGTTLVRETDFGSLDCATPRSSYSEGKRAAETIAVAYSAQHGIDVHLARFGHIYGPGMHLDDGRVQADFASRVMAGTDIVLTGDGTAVRTYTYVGDATSGLLHALLADQSGPINVADSAGRVSIRQLADLFVAARPAKQLAVRFTSGQPVQGVSTVTGMGLDDTRLRNLGWRPSVSLEEGIDRTLTHHEWEATLA